MENSPEFIDTKLQEKSCYYFLIMHLEKKTQKFKTDEILKACARFLSFSLVLQLCNRVTTSQACYMRMQSFSATQCVIFSCSLLIRLNAAAFISFFVIRSLKFCTIKTHQQSLEMKIYRTASKPVIKTNGVQKVFFCLRIDSKYMNTVIDQRGKECWEVREKLA